MEDFTIRVTDVGLSYLVGYMSTTNAAITYGRLIPPEYMKGGVKEIDFDEACDVYRYTHWDEVS